MRHLQQSCSAIDIFHAFLILQMHIHSHGLQLRSSAGSCNRHNKNLFGSEIRQLLLLSKYPQIYPKPYPKRTCKSIFQSGIFLYHFGTSPFCCHNTFHILHRKVTPRQYPRHTPAPFPHQITVIIPLRICLVIWWCDSSIITAAKISANIP